jgi:hypothetical protein
LSLGGPFRWLTDIQSRFPDVFASCENGFIPPEFCFVAHPAKKHSRLAEQTRHVRSGSAADEI